MWFWPFEKMMKVVSGIAESLFGEQSSCVEESYLVQSSEAVVLPV
jgi:hypothetical protein